jgi:hypothetical protein
MEYFIYALWGWVVINVTVSISHILIGTGQRLDRHELWEDSKIYALQAIMAMLAIQLLR